MRNALLTAITFGAIIFGSTCVTAVAQPPETDPSCDRECLEGYMDRYLEAMLNNNVRDDLFAREVKFTENGIRLPLGNEGLWYGMSGLEGYRFYVPDLETQQIALIGTVKENMSNNGVNDGAGNNVAIAVRLAIEDERITEVEQLVIRPEVQLGGGDGGDGGDDDGGGMFGNVGDNVVELGEPHEIYRQSIPEDERHTREELVEVANYYFTALARHDSEGYYPFTEDCMRLENGIVATDDCLEQFEGDSLNDVVSRIRDRRFVAVDVERGIAFSFAFFDHHDINWTWQLAELFKIENGKIRRIEAVFHQAPFGMTSGWSTYEEAMSEEIQSVR